jgi:hypothetical protein
MVEPQAGRQAALREHLGVWLKDRWRYERKLRSRTRAYLALTNRNERLSTAPDGEGYGCLWQFTSDLHAPRLQPGLGLRLLRRCLDDAPIERRVSPDPFEGSPQITVLIGHRGVERLPLLLATLESFAAQEQLRLECVVIEQDRTSHIAAALPRWVRHVLAPLADPEAPYNRSHTFNVGALHARSPVLLLHDNDMLVPTGYGRRILDRISQGYEVVNPKRYIFYLSQEHSKQVLQRAAGYDRHPAEAIVQNLEAGGSMAITRSTFQAIGGMDDRFVGWGGEDNEFWDRCLTRPTWIWGYEPIVHLWHSSQPLKQTALNPNIELCRELLSVPVQVRIHRLSQAWKEAMKDAI